MSTIKIYRLAKLMEYGVRMAFGPVMTLTQAERYQSDMSLAGFPCVILNTKEGFDPSLTRTKAKVWTRFTLGQG